LWYNLLGGLLAGILTACGGAIKDSPYEGFRIRTFLRSPIVGLICGYLTHFFTHEFIVIVLCSGYMERIVVEGWKLVRCQKPGKFEFGEWGIPKKIIYKATSVIATDIEAKQLSVREPVTIENWVNGDKI
jgi:hypothetical protein